MSDNNNEVNASTNNHNLFINKKYFDSHTIDADMIKLIESTKFVFNTGNSKTLKTLHPDGHYNQALTHDELYYKCENYREPQTEANVPTDKKGKKRPRDSTKDTGCLAKVTFRTTSDKQSMSITNLCLEHNHPPPDDFEKAIQKKKRKMEEAKKRKTRMQSSQQVEEHNQPEHKMQDTNENGNNTNQDESESERPVETESIIHEKIEECRNSIKQSDKRGENEKPEVHMVPTGSRQGRQKDLLVESNTCPLICNLCTSSETKVESEHILEINELLHHFKLNLIESPAKECEKKLQKMKQLLKEFDANADESLRLDSAIMNEIKASMPVLSWEDVQKAVLNGIALSDGQSDENVLKSNEVETDTQMDAKSDTKPESAVSALDQNLHEAQSVLLDDQRLTDGDAATTYQGHSEKALSKTSDPIEDTEVSPGMAEMQASSNETFETSETEKQFEETEENQETSTIIITDSLAANITTITRDGNIITKPPMPNNLNSTKLSPVKTRGRPKGAKNKPIGLPYKKSKEVKIDSQGSSQKNKLLSSWLISSAKK